MTTHEDEFYGEYIYRKGAGEGMRKEFETLILAQPFNFDPKLITQYGVLCLDVGHGPEIAAFQPYNPPILHATENYLPDDDEETPEKRGAIKRLGQDISDHGIFLFDEAPWWEVFETLREQQMRYGLITRFNIHPEQFDHSGHITPMIESAPDLLVPGGMIILSATEERDLKIFHQVKRETVDIGLDQKLDIQLTELPELGLIGRYLLTAKLKNSP